MRDLFDNGSKSYIMSFNFVQKLSFNIQNTSVGVQKIGGSAIERFRIIIANFQVDNKTGQFRFF